MKLFMTVALLISTGLIASTPAFCLVDDISTNELTSSSYNTPTYQTPTLNQDDAKAQMQYYAQTGITNYLPIQTPKLTPGDVTPKALNNPQLIQPFFLVGSDNRSRQWLLQNREQLKRIHAIGLLVQANTLNDVQTMQSLSQGLTLIPAPANELIKRYGLEHYPVLITKEGITQ